MPSLYDTGDNCGVVVGMRRALVDIQHARSSLMHRGHIVDAVPCSIRFIEEVKLKLKSNSIPFRAREKHRVDDVTRFYTASSMIVFLHSYTRAPLQPMNCT